VEHQLETHRNWNLGLEDLIPETAADCKGNGSWEEGVESVSCEENESLVAKKMRANNVLAKWGLWIKTTIGVGGGVRWKAMSKRGE
jgi:hypothetical protein